jgi:predicted small secreted protein
MTRPETLLKAALILTGIIFVALLLTACKTNAGAGIGDASWSGGITCQDGICTPTLTIGYAPKTPQLEK